MAAPHVTGVLALVMADKGNDLDRSGIVSSKEVISVIAKRVQDLGPVGFDNIYGNGVLMAVN